MDIATPEMLRLLRYLRTLNGHGVYPSEQQLDAYASTILPATVLINNRDQEMWDDVLFDQHYEVKNTVQSYVMQVGWVEVTGRGAELTDLGRAVDAGAHESNVRSSESPVISIVLKGNDPLSYVQLIEAIQRVSGETDVLLIDPYLPAIHLSTLVDIAGVTRVLTSDVAVSDANESREQRTKRFSLVLGSRAERGIAVRYAKKGAIHDRLILPTKGPGLMVGRSLGGRQLTAVVELNDQLTTLFRNSYAPKWAEATPVSPVDLTHLGDGTN